MPKREDLKKITCDRLGTRSSLARRRSSTIREPKPAKPCAKKAMKSCWINSNPATIMTDEEMADRVYIEPITLDTVSDILRSEQPQGIIATLGGQTGLNMAVELAESGMCWSELGIELLGTSLTSPSSKRKTASCSRKRWSASASVSRAAVTAGSDGKEAVAFAEEKSASPSLSAPLTRLGGTGGGIAHDMAER